MLMTDLQSLMGHSSELTATLQKLLVLLEGDNTRNGLLDSYDEALDATLTLLQQTEDLCDTMITSIALIRNGISRSQAMNSAMIQLSRTAAEALGLYSSTLTALAQTCDALADLSDALAKRLTRGVQAEQSAHEIMQGLSEVLGQSIKGLAVTHSLRGSGSTMHRTLGEQLNRLEASSNILSLNPDARLISFTSDRNRTPESIQVILRTQEITLAKSGPASADAEKAKSDRGVWGRIADIFIRIGKAIAGIFK
jgi:hypothetical protein